MPLMEEGAKERPGRTHQSSPGMTKDKRITGLQAASQTQVLPCFPPVSLPPLHPHTNLDT